MTENFRPHNESQARSMLAEVLETALNGDVERADKNLSTLRSHVGDWLQMESETASWSRLFGAVEEALYSLESDDS